MGGGRWSLVLDRGMPGVSQEGAFEQKSEWSKEASPVGLEEQYDRKRESHVQRPCSGDKWLETSVPEAG